MSGGVMKFVGKEGKMCEIGESICGDDTLEGRMQEGQLCRNQSTTVNRRVMIW